MDNLSNADVVGRVVKILAGGRAVANIGLEAGVKPGDIFAVFELKESLLNATLTRYSLLFTRSVLEAG